MFINTKRKAYFWNIVCEAKTSSFVSNSTAVYAVSFRITDYINGILNAIMMSLHKYIILLERSDFVPLFM
jgi:hypothetical protein